METGRLFAEFKAMWIKHPLADRVFSVCDYLREGQRGSPPGTEQIAASLLADSQSGKTTAIKTYIDRNVVRDCYERGLFPKSTPHEVVRSLQRLVLYVPLSSGASVSSMLADILEALGDPLPHKGTVPERRSRMLVLLKACNTELIIIDEIQHLATPVPTGPISKREEATNVQNNLKSILLKGWPVLFVGLPEARVKIFSDKQVDLRIEEEIEFGPLKFIKSEDRKIFTDYCGRLGLKLQQHGVFKDRVDLLSNETPAKLFIVSKARLGVVSAIVRHGCKFAFRSGADTLMEKHLSMAADRYVQKKFSPYNPFDGGIRPLDRSDLFTKNERATLRKKSETELDTDPLVTENG